MNRAIGILHALAMAALVAGCGGGGGDSGTPAAGPGPGVIASTDSFPLQDGYRARLVAGSSDSFAISGSCAGTAQNTNGAATATTFEGTAGFGILQTSTVTFTKSCLQNGQPTTSASGTSYYDANYAPIGATVTGLEYSDLNGPPASLPASVKVGDSAVYAMLTTYINDQKAFATGKRELSYVIEADTADTVIVDLVAKTSDISNNLRLTQQTRYRMAADGSLTMVSIDIDYPAPNAAHLHYTKTGT